MRNSTSASFPTARWVKASFCQQHCKFALYLRDEHQRWGGYPPVWQRTGEAARLNWLKDYRKTYLERNIADVGQVANIDTFALAQKLLCSRTANLFSISEVSRDLGVAVNTIKLQPVEPELYFYRTAAGLEEDFLLASERGIIPIEAKSSARVTAADGRSVETFMEGHPDAAKVGLVIYPGDEVVELRRNVWGVPDWYLLGAL